MKALLMHVGADSSSKATVGICGPIFSDNKFEFIPIVESNDTNEMLTYSTFTAKNKQWGKFLSDFIPADLKDEKVHKDPDFANLTYSDPQHSMRAKMLTKLEPGDFLFFVTSLAPFYNRVYKGQNRTTIQNCQRKKMSKYIIGFFEIEQIVICEKNNSNLDILDSREIMRKYLKRIENNAHSKRKFDKFVCAVGKKTQKSPLLSNPIKLTHRGFPFQPTMFGKKVYGNVSYPRGFKIITNNNSIKTILEKIQSTE